MNKSELIKSVKDELGTEKAATEAVNAVLNALEKALVANEAIQLIGFGTFKVTERAARKGRNPQTGEEMEIPASKSVTFKAGKSLKEKL